MAGIFISYRRDDSRHAAGRLADDLGAVFGADSIFRDIESIAPGVDFEVALDQALASCAVMLVVIGPRWATLTDREGRRRLDQPGDWIRIEVARALERNVRLIPVMLEDTPLPDVAALPPELRGLVRRQTLPLSDGRWKGDVQKLVEALERIPGLQRVAGAPVAVPAPSPAPKPKAGLWTGVALGAGALAVLGYCSSIPDPAMPVQPAPVVVAPQPEAQAAAPAPAPAPAPNRLNAPAAALPSLTPPDQLKAIADQVLEGRWQTTDQEPVLIVMQQRGSTVSARLSGQGQPLGQGTGQFDGQRLVIDLQVQILGQPLMQGRCTMLWQASPPRLHGPCQWPVGTEIVAWNRVGS